MSQQQNPWYEHQPNHDHFTLLYESKEEQFKSVVPFIEDGLKANDFCLYIAHNNTESEIIEAFKSSEIDVESAIRTGQFSMYHADDVGLTEDDFDPIQVVSDIEEKSAEAVEEGYDRLRIAGETGSAIGESIELGVLEEYEKQLDELFPTNSMIGLCQYDKRELSPEQICSIIQAHPFVLNRAEKQLNCYYQLPEERIGQEIKEKTIDRKLQTISDQQNTLISLQKREHCLSLLQQSTEQLRHAEPHEIEEIAADIISEIVDPGLIFFMSHEKSDGQITSEIIQGTLQGAEPESLTTELQDQVWEAFVDNEVQEFAQEWDQPISGLIIPTGQHGAFLVAADQSYEITDTDIDFIRAVCGHTVAVLDRTQYEHELEMKNEELKTKNSRLESLSRINSVVREINQSLVEASEIQEILQNVCKLLVDKTQITFTWYGSYDSATETLQPEQKAGDEQSYLEALDLDDEWTNKEPSGQAARSHAIQVIPNIYDEPPLEQWQKQALKRGYQSNTSLPICYDNSLYGVLALYSDSPHVFDDEIVAVLKELSSSIAYAVNNIRRKKALVTDTVTELEIDVTDSNFEIIDFANKHDWTVEVDDVVADPDGGFRVFSTIHNANVEDIRSFAAAAPTLAHIEVFDEKGTTHKCECLITDQCFMAELLNHNTVPQQVSVEENNAHLLLHLPQEESVREFMEMFTAKYPETEVVARSTKEKSLRRVSDVEAELEDELTERQLEILTLAYHSGYFNRPRERTAEEIAELLDVSHPTVSRHLREAERKVFAMLLEYDK